MSAYSTLIRPLLFTLPPEQAHHVAMGLLKQSLRLELAQRLCRRWLRVKHPMLRQHLFGLDFCNPVGLAAGFDKNATSINELAALGFSHIEAGSVTALQQDGNPKPRSFRLPKDKSLINRMGFNNDGSAKIAERLAASYDHAQGQRRPPCVLGINIGKSKLAEDPIADHVQSLEAVALFADYLVVNVSCPNVAGVTALQHAKNLRPLLSTVRERLRELAPQCQMLVKISPDLTEGQLLEALDIILDIGTDGIIATNTSTSREGLQTSEHRLAEIANGGLSGTAIRERSLAVLRTIARHVDGRVPIIGVGGIDSPQAAWEKICNGASLVQVYTGFIYTGPFLMRQINRYCIAQLKHLGLRHIREAVGRDL